MLINLFRKSTDKKTKEEATKTYEIKSGHKRYMVFMDLKSGNMGGLGDCILSYDKKSIAFTSGKVLAMSDKYKRVFVFDRIKAIVFVIEKERFANIKKGD